MGKTQDQRTERIAELNDQARRGLSLYAKLMLTRGIADMKPDDQSAIIRAVQNFDDFTEDNNPHGERDFGAFTHNGQKIFWKIDYYDRKLEMGSPDAADPAVTTRVLTIMLAEEY